MTHKVQEIVKLGITMYNSVQLHITLYDFQWFCRLDYCHKGCMDRVRNLLIALHLGWKLCSECQLLDNRGKGKKNTIKLSELAIFL